MTWAFIESETAHDAELFEAWQDIDGGLTFSPRYSELFMKLEETLSTAMKKDWELPDEDMVPVWTPPEIADAAQAAEERNAKSQDGSTQR